MAKLEPVSLNKLKAGFHSDGGNLYLRVKDTGAKSWVFRFKQSGKVREIGIGPLKTLSLSEARKLATKMRLALLDGINPDTLLDRNKKKAKTFKEHSIDYIDSKRDEWKNSKHTQQWENTLSEYVYPKIGNKAAEDVSLADVLAVLTPIWKNKTETASRVRGRIESVLDFAAVKEQFDKRNPARWKGNLDKVLASPKKIISVKHHPSLAYQDIPCFMDELRSINSIASSCLHFLILTATRSSEARGALWGEIDIERRIWEIPASRMKADRNHRIPLNDEAVEILQRMLAFKNDKTDLVFNTGRGNVISDVTINNVLKRIQVGITVHGFRSTFRVWGAETTSFPHLVLEFALAHNIQTETEKAYQRSDLFERRRELMNAWGNHCKPVRNVINLAQETERVA